MFPVNRSDSRYRLENDRVQHELKKYKQEVRSYRQTLQDLFKKIFDKIGVDPRSASQPSEDSSSLAPNNYYEVSVEEELPLPPGSVKGTISQYDATFGKAACGSIAIRAAHAMLSDLVKKPRDVDSVVSNGVMNYVEVGPIIQSREGWETTPVYDEDGYLSFDFCWYGSELCTKLDVDRDDTGKIKEIKMDQAHGESVMDFYMRLLEQIRKAAIDKNLPVVGILTINSSTYAIKYDPNTKTWNYFNSHGTDRVYGKTAMMLTFCDDGVVDGDVAVAYQLETIQPEVRDHGLYIVTKK